ncbi:MAG: transcriptional repressor [Oscillospiraceae bacterium]|nr:transcriptional repressor [Oscillospiraceae bacterium]
MEKTTRYSKKREAILMALRDTEGHPTAEWLYQKLKPEHPDLSLGTVYRNLTLFREQGQIRSVGVVDGHERFDANTADHPHFVCEGCHAVIDIPGIEDDRQVERAVSHTYGFAARHHDLTVYGLCGDCMQSQSKA